MIQKFDESDKKDPQRNDRNNHKSNDLISTVSISNTFLALMASKSNLKSFLQGSDNNKYMFFSNNSALLYHNQIAVVYGLNII